MKNKIIYFTTSCNLKCSYCYEREEYEHVQDKVISYERLDEIINEIVQEKDQIGCIILFGGEPLLAHEQLFYFLKKLTTLGLTNIPLNMATNGTILAINDDIFEKFVSLTKHLPFSLEISYDGCYHDETRCFPNGKSSKQLVESLFEKLKAISYPFRIRYSLHKKALEDLHKTFKDIIRIIIEYNPERIILNRIYSEVDPPSYEDSYLMQGLSSIYKHLHVPLCDFVCDECKLCNKSTKELEYIGNSSKESIIPGKKPTFHDFTKLF